MTTTAQAVDAVMGLLRTAWLASATTQEIAVYYEDVVGDPKPGEEITDPGLDELGKPLPWARFSMRHTSGRQDTLAPVGQRRFLAGGIVTVQVFTPFGDGRTLSDQVVAVVKTALRARHSSGVWFNDVRIEELGQDGPWFNVNVVADFRYQERG